ncbi:MAG TPA: FAD-dependent monooxygenase [Chloroflexia bacterium]|nr:FAD-dependent monooxygenase [Chloroflexia bacterium]
MVNHSITPDLTVGRRLGASAVVIGGSIAGLVSARILADYFQQVTLIERDPLPDENEPRKGVPQGRHGHGLLGKGQEIMLRYFPGLFEDLQRQGAVPIDLAYDAGWYQGGHWRLRVKTGVTVSVQSRPLLEATIRRRVRAIPNIRFLTESDAEGLQMNPARTAVTGVLVRRRGEDSGPTTVAADLVVDAGGRGSRMAHWLEESGYSRVEETQVKMNVGYTTRIFRRKPMPGATWKGLIIIPTPPDTRMGILLPIEGDRWILSLAGWHQDYAPTDEAGFLEYARSLPRPTIYEAIKDAEPLTPIVLHKIPSSLWRRYDRMARFPERLVVLGDALCSFNPTYAQGMTTGCLYAAALDTCLQKQAHGSAGDLTGLADSFRKRAAGIVADPWMMATGEDFRYAQTEGKRPPVLPVMHRYLNRVLEAESHDPYVVQQFLQVLHMMRSPAAMFSPPVVLRVLTARLRYKGVSSMWPEESAQEESSVPVLQELEQSQQGAY